ncbi:MAG: Nif11-like leader peptide family natural product precursor [Atopobiaceae bacterium]|nr:Nif11-like leader peptide family natural product precursor [Atopobiaceae bacterium]
MGIENLTPEQMEKAKSCKTIEELEQLAHDEGLELSAEELKGIAGGICKHDCDWLGAQCRNDYECRTRQ